MNKFQMLSKFLGVVVGLFLGQALYAQKTDSRFPTTPPPTVTYVNATTAMTRINTKINQYLGQAKQNGNPASQAFQTAETSRQYYAYLRAYIQEGTSVKEAIIAAMQKLRESGATLEKEQAAALVGEASALLKQ
jgi:hypothetical protein